MQIARWKGRFELKYSAGPLPHAKLMRSIELYGTRVIPLVRELLFVLSGPTFGIAAPTFGRGLPLSSRTSGASVGIQRPFSMAGSDARTVDPDTRSARAG